MNDWDKLLAGLVFLAIVAVIIANQQTASAVTSLGSALAQFTKNVVTLQPSTSGQTQ